MAPAYTFRIALDMQTLPFSAEAKNIWSYTFTTLYACKVWYLAMKYDSSTILPCLVITIARYEGPMKRWPRLLNTNRMDTAIWEGYER
jgi:hypothetical protein